LSTSLSTQILPPCFFTNSLQSNNPKLVPFSFAVPVVVRTWEISNSFAKLSGVIPIPLSETDIIAFSEFSSAVIFIAPALFVNFLFLSNYVSDRVVCH
jgi:hypothetical protein